MASDAGYRISTITVVARVCTAAAEATDKTLDLMDAFRTVRLGGGGGGGGGLMRICTCKYGSEIRAATDGSMCCDTQACRHRVAKVPKPNVRKPTKLFGDQVTLVCRLDGHPDVASVKLFSNGRIHLTGARSEENARSFVREVSSTLQSSIELQSDDAVWTDPMDEFQICMINSDCDLGFQIKRTSLVQSLMRHFPSVSIAYDPCMYPGVQIKFMWNAHNSSGTRDDGVCRCSPRCSGKGRGDSIGSCRKVTIAVFQTGRVIITGAHSTQQLDDAYSFVTSKVAIPFRHEINLKPLGPT
jgi:TATA-box binding protein (TBP) (component of TFIID and TFIIIB)